MASIAENISTVREEIGKAAVGCGRAAASVALLAVSKTQGPDKVREAYAAGQRDFGENYVQEALGKISALPLPGLCWHFIGPIQSNKTREIAEYFQWVHSVDRLKIAQRLSEQRPAHLPPLQLCLQVNVDGGDNKSGVPPQEALALAREVTALPNVRLRGVMSIPEPAPNFIAALASLTEVRAVFDALNAEGLALDTLSIGMSADLEAAIHAGSTMVRVGSAIFGGR